MTIVLVGGKHEPRRDAELARHKFRTTSQHPHQPGSSLSLITKEGKMLKQRFLRTTAIVAIILALAIDWVLRWFSWMKSVPDAVVLGLGGTLILVVLFLFTLGKKLRPSGLVLTLVFFATLLGILFPILGAPSDRPVALWEAILLPPAALGFLVLFYKIYYRSIRDGGVTSVVASIVMGTWVGDVIWGLLGAFLLYGLR